MFSETEYNLGATVLKMQDEKEQVLRLEIFHRLEELEYKIQQVLERDKSDQWKMISDLQAELAKVRVHERRRVQLQTPTP